MNYLKEGHDSDYFNLGSGKGYSVLEMVEAARKVTKHSIKANIEERRPGDPARLIASSDKAKKVLHWSPKHNNVEEIIESAWNFHVTHKEGY